MNRRTLVKLLGAATAVGVGGVSPRASAAEILKLGTLFPASSPWGKTLTVWADAVNKKSAGALQLQIFFNGRQGDEDAMVGKMKSGQLDAGVISAVGLGKIHKPVLAMHMPGLFTQWSKLDAARDAMKAEFEQGIVDAGFDTLGWFDIGAVRWMSKGFQIKVPDDIKGRKPCWWRPDAIHGALYLAVGGISPVPLSVPEVLPNLNTGAIDVVPTAALLAEQLQWSSKLDTLVTNVSSLAIGGIVVSSTRFALLPAELRQILVDTGKIACAAMLTRMRKEDDAAFARLKGKMTVVTMTSDEQAKWDGLHKQVRQRLAMGTFAPELVAKLEGLAAV